MPCPTSRAGTAAVYPTGKPPRRFLVRAICADTPCGHSPANPDPATGGYRGLALGACNVRGGARRGRARQDSTRLCWYGVGSVAAT